MNLDRIGWNKEYSKILLSISSESEIIPGRVSSFSGKHYRILCEKGEQMGILPNSFLNTISEKSEIPAVGDWVGLVQVSGVDLFHIRYVFPRTNKLSRKVSGNASEEQIIAANIDIVLIVTSLDNDFNLNRLERYLSMVYGINAIPIIVLNKIDKVDDSQRYVDKIRGIASDVRIVPMCAQSGVGIDNIRSLSKSGTSLVLVGSSGVGKSTIINQLLGHIAQDTGDTREDDDKGRHITSSRQLFLLPQGGTIIDNPGIRELQLWSSKDGLKRQFNDIEKISLLCRFSDCHHEDEPGCAVRDALELGTISRNHYENYLKLLKEKEFLDIRRNTFEKRKKEKKLGKVYRTGKDIRRMKGKR